MMNERIPDSDSITELARFWETHDVTDFEAELQAVDEPVFADGIAGHRVLVRLTNEEAKAVRAAAQARGVDEATLIHEWIREHAAKAAG